METKMIRIPQEMTETFAIMTLANSRALLLDEVQNLGADYGSLPAYRREDFRDSMETFHAADLMLRYYTTQDQYNSLVR
jgi:uroporphyrinogen-III synthase